MSKQEKKAPVKRAADGTREYRPHSGQMRKHAAMDGAPAGLGALNASVYEGLRNKDFYPGLAYSGEVARQGKDGRPRMEDSVVRHQVEMRQEMPYG